jgi:hypothetical protein
MWLSIASGLISLLEKAGEYALVKLLRKHSDQLLALDQELIEWNKAFAENTDNRDDLRFVEIMQQKAVIEAALLREIQLASKK